jgi:hypothetical protein
VRSVRLRLDAFERVCLDQLSEAGSFQAQLSQHGGVNAGDIVAMRQGVEAGLAGSSVNLGTTLCSATSVLR